MGKQQISHIVIKKSNKDKYSVSLECSNCGVTENFDEKDEIYDYVNVQELVEQFLEDECLCSDCLDEE